MALVVADAHHRSLALWASNCVDRDRGYILDCTLLLPTDGIRLEQRLGEMISDWQGAYATSYEGYEKMRQDFLSERGFPSDLFEYWALLEKKWLQDCQ